MQDRFAAITELTDAVCAEHLNDEYADLIRAAAAAMSRKRPSPLANGAIRNWAAALTHAVGMTNFLQDRDQTPHLSASALYSAFGVSQSNTLAKSKQIRDALGMTPMHPDWCLPSMLADNPMVWMMQSDGFIVDARQLPREQQEQLVQAGVIPFVHPDAQDAADFVEAGLSSRQTGGKTATGRPDGAASVGSSREEGKLSVRVLGVADPLLESGISQEDAELIILLAVTSWNASSLCETDAQALLASVETEQLRALTDEAHAQYQATTQMLMARKRELYPEDTRYVVSYQLRHDGQGWCLRVAGVADAEQYLDYMRSQQSAATRAAKPAPMRPRQPASVAQTQAPTSQLILPLERDE
jgi:hypothetical protein